MNSSTRSLQQQCSKLQLCHSIQAALCCISEALSAADADSPQQEAWLILQQGSGLSRESLLCNLQSRPTPESLTMAADALVRRLQGEPLQYILGKAWFYGREFAVDSRVLIPRPETEHLVEVAKELSTRMPRCGGTLALLEVGTGSGALAITLAEELPASRLTACDASGTALQVARENVARYRAGSRVSLVQSDLGGPFRAAFGGVLANLPYIPSADVPSLRREVRDHEPRLALDGGPDGLREIRRLIDAAPGLLLPGSWLLLEVGIGQADPIAGLLTCGPSWRDVDVRTDLAGIPRVVWGRFTGMFAADANPRSG